MGHLLQKINGAVFFVDILGFGALTQNKIKLSAEDFKSWGIPRHLKKDNQSLAATILVDFRKILSNLSLEYNDVTISQLSDCAFIWSENIKDVIIVAHKIMWNCLESGILCRAGLSCGEIIETSQNNELGRLIAGKAVSDAVKLEGLAKGARIMIDQDVYRALFEYDRAFCNKISFLFRSVTNPLDYNTYDEFKWYYVPELNQINNPFDDGFIINVTKARLKLVLKLRMHPRFSWNSKSKEGLAQLIPSILFISKNEQTIFKINHWFEWNNIIENRSSESINRIENQIDYDFSTPINKDGIITFNQPE